MLINKIGGLINAFPPKTTELESWRQDNFTGLSSPALHWGPWFKPNESAVKRQFLLSFEDEY